MIERNEVCPLPGPSLANRQCKRNTDNRDRKDRKQIIFKFDKHENYLLCMLLSLFAANLFAGIHLLELCISLAHYSPVLFFYTP